MSLARSTDKPTTDRIGIMYLTTSPFPGGAAYGLRSIVRHLDRRRFRPVIVLPEEHCELADFFREADVEIATVRSCSLSGWSPKTLAHWVTTARELARIARRHNVQIFHSTAPRAAVLGPLVRALSGVRFVWQIAMLGQPWYFHFLARFADRAPCVSRAVYEEFGARKSMLVIHNGPWTEALSPEELAVRRGQLRQELGISEDALVVGCVANVQHWKGIHVVLDGFVRVAREMPQAVLVHLGGPAPGYEAYARQIGAQIEALGLAGRIQRLGFRPDAYRYYPVFDLLVHVPVVEGRRRTTEAFGHSIAEAMGYRLPVIASRLGGPAEIVEEGVTGELIEPGNAEELAQKTLALLRNPERRRRMGEEGHARYQRHFTIQREVQDYQKLYLDLAGQPAAAPEGFRRHWQRVLKGENFSEGVRLWEIEQGPFVAQLARCLPRAGPKPARVLEVGAGGATASRLLARRCKGLICALDILPEAMQVAQRASRNGKERSVHLVVADVRCAPFAAASFDLVFSQGLLEHFPEPDEIFSAHVRLVKPGGHLVINVPQRYNLYTLYKRRRFRRGCWPPGWETEYSSTQLTALGRQFGLEVSEVDGHGSFLRGVTLRLLRPVLSVRLQAAVLRGFDALDRPLSKRLRARLCPNLVVSFRKPLAVGEEKGIRCRS